MMKSVHVMGTAGSGKTAICLALALDLKDRGLKVGYFKPVGWPPRLEGSDEDACLFKQVLGLEHELQELVPVVTNPFYLTKYGVDSDLRGRVVEAFGRVSKGKDLVIVEGTHSPRTMAALGLDSPALSDLLDSIPLLVRTAENDYAFDQVVLYAEYMKLRGRPFMGVIFNNIPQSLLHKIRDVYCPLLDSKKVSCLGVVPSQREIASPTVREVVEVLGGELLSGEDNLDLLVEGTLIGAMSMESALSYLRRVPNKALITGGDRSDLALAALETSTSVIVLTGGIYPSINVVARARDKGTPVLLVSDDTFAAIEKLQSVSRKIRPGDTSAIAMARKMFTEHCDRQSIMDLLGVL